MRPFDRFAAAFKHKRVLIFGLGLLGGGTGVTQIFREVGAKVRITDQKTAAELQPSLALLGADPSLEYSLEGHRQADIDWAEVIVRNPSVPWQHELLNYARIQRKLIVMETQLFVSYAQIPTIGITGTRGKTTTTMMLASILKQHSPKQLILGGNLAHQPVLPQLKAIINPSETLALLELSSWQLQAFHLNRLSVNYALLTNLYPDHLNYYATLQDYYQDKTALFAYQSPADTVVFNAAQPEFNLWATAAPGQVQWFDEHTLPADYSLLIPGDHNRLNAAGALTLAQTLGIGREQALASLSGFKGTPYRLETVKVDHGLTYINDTTSTTPAATLAALSSCPVPPLLLLGGHDKNLPLEALAKAANNQAKRLFLLSGSGTARLKPLLDPTKIAGEFPDLAQAFAAARAVGQPGDIVLLSPGFASFGMFKNEFDRGDQFNRLVAAL